MRIPHFAAFLLALSLPAGAADLPFPLTPLAEPGDGLLLSPEAQGLLALADPTVEHARLVGAVLPDGSIVDLDVERIPHARSAQDIRLDGVPVPSTLEATAASLWGGTVAGDPSSEVFLALSLAGCRGWIRREGELVHLLADRGPAPDWSMSRVRMITERELVRLGATLGEFCQVDPNVLAEAGRELAGTTYSAELGTAPPRLCRVAIETDWQFYQLFGDLGAAEAYTDALFAAANERYVAQANTILEIAYLGLHSNSNDGWSTPDSGGGAGAMLDEFRGAWLGNVPNNAQLSHFWSGANLGGGVAWLNGICNSSLAFAVSGNMAGNVPFPVTQGPLTWDFVVFTHEQGHQFGTPHTHDFCPTPLDQCAPSGYFGTCQTSQQCISNGTIMSYCHLCSGGMSNITTWFHPEVQNLITLAASVCVPEACTADVTYCSATANSTGSPAWIDRHGSTSVAANDLVLDVASAIPGQFGVFFYGPEQASVPFGNGLRCVGAGSLGLFRFTPPVLGDLFGDASYAVDLTTAPANAGAGRIDPFSTWNFQFWYRDPAAGGAGFNLSNALQLHFCP